MVSHPPHRLLSGSALFTVLALFLGGLLVLAVGWGGSAGGVAAAGQSWDVLRDLSRILGVTLLLSVSLCGIAIPLTANVYTPKLVEIFIADRRTQLVLGYLVAANGLVLWAKYVLDGGLVADQGRWLVWLCLVVGVAALVITIPYMYFVLRFLVPRNIVARLRSNVLAHLREAASAADDAQLDQAKQSALEDIQYLGSMVLRSVDRYDRDTAFEGIQAMRSVCDAWQEQCSQIPARWFTVGPGILHGFSPELKPEVERRRALLEVALLEEVALVVPLAIERMPEIVERLASLTQYIGVAVARRDGGAAIEMVTLYFNSFLRATLDKRRARAFYQFVYRYRRLAEEQLSVDPAVTLRIAFFLDYYGHQATRMNMGYLINVVAYDLAEVCDLAWRRGVDKREALLDIFIDLDRDDEGLIEMPGVVKAQMILAAKLLARDQLEAAERLVIELKKVSPSCLQDSFGQILAARDENFWEIADRRRHLDHVDAELRPLIDRLHERLLGEAPAAPQPISPGAAAVS